MVGDRRGSGTVRTHHAGQVGHVGVTRLDVDAPQPARAGPGEPARPEFRQQLRWQLGSEHRLHVRQVVMNRPLVQHIQEGRNEPRIYILEDALRVENLQEPGVHKSTLVRIPATWVLLRDD